MSMGGMPMGGMPMGMGGMGGMPMGPPRQNNNLLLIGIVLLIALGAFYYFYSSSTTATTTSPPTTTTEPSAEQTPTPTQLSTPTSTQSSQTQFLGIWYRKSLIHGKEWYVLDANGSGTHVFDDSGPFSRTHYVIQQIVWNADGYRRDNETQNSSTWSLVEPNKLRVDDKHGNIVVLNRCVNDECVVPRQ